MSYKDFQLYTSREARRNFFYVRYDEANYFTLGWRSAYGRIHVLSLRVEL